jgi:hypothetical protein
LPAFYGNRNFIPVCRGVHRLPLSRTRLLQFTHSHPFPLRSILIISSHLLSFEWFLSFMFLYHNPVCISPLSHTCHMPRPSPSWFDDLDNSLCRVQFLKLLSMQFCAVSCYLVPLDPNIFLSSLFTNTRRIRSSSTERDNVIVLYILILISLSANRKTKYSGRNGSRNSLSSICS